MRKVNLNAPAAASSETARDINRRLVLNLIRNNQQISRADLARCSGLQRSTVSLIIEDLIATDWVFEGETGRLPRGRRPTYLELNLRRAAVCVDIRPLLTTIGIGDVTGEFHFVEEIRTPVTPSSAVAAISDAVEHIRQKYPDRTLDGIGVSLPGRIDPSTNQLLFAPNLQWPAYDLRGPLEEATGLHIELENAANACALSEMWFQASPDLQDSVTVTVSEGIGTGIIAHGQLITGRRGMAGEFGHVSLDENGPPCRCGNRGCWEVLASNRAALRYFCETNPNRNEETPDFSFADLLAAAKAEDATASAALNRMAEQLGRGTRMIVAALAPQCITFIGEFTAAWERFYPVIASHVNAQSISPDVTVLRAGNDGAMARVRGTIALVFQKHFGAPPGY